MLPRANAFAAYVFDQIQIIVFWIAITGTAAYAALKFYVVRSVTLNETVIMALNLTTFTSTFILLLATGFLNERYLGKLCEHRMFVAIGFLAAAFTAAESVVATVALLLRQSVTP